MLFYTNTTIQFNVKSDFERVAKKKTIIKNIKKTKKDDIF